jgi:hypothetical protein
MMTDLYHVQSLTEEPCHLTADALSIAQSSWLCGECASAKPGTRTIDVQLESPPARDSPLNFVMGTSVSIARKKFLLRLGLDVIGRDLFVGKVIDKQGRPLDEWATFRGRASVIIRGTEYTSRGHCSSCGRELYFAVGGDLHLCPVVDDVSVLESDRYGLVLGQALLEKLRVDDWSGLHVDRLPVVARCSPDVQTN